MAYKFQLGNATLSGSLTQKEGLNAGDDGLANAGAIAGATSIDGSGDLTMGTITMTGFTVDADGDTALKSLLVDDSSTIGCDSDTDLLTLASGILTVAGEVSMTTLDIGGTNVSATAAELNLIDGDTARGTTAVASGDGFLHNDAGTMRMTSVDKIADLFAGSGLAASSGVLSVNVDGLSALGGTGVADADVFLFSDDGTEKKIAFSNLYGAVFGNMQGQASVNAGGDISLDVSAITGQTEMTGDVADADELMISDGGVLKRLDFSVLRDAVFADVSGDATVGSGGALTIADDAVEQAMIADDAVGADQLASNAVVNDSVASNAAIALSKINTNVDMGGNFTIGDQADDTAIFTGGLTVGGDLTVNGTTTTVNSTTIEITGAFAFDGTTPGGNKTTLNAVDPTANATLRLPAMSAGTYFVPVLAASSTTAITATPAEINLIDGDTARGTTAVASGDGFLHNDGGTMRMTSVDKIADLFAGSGLAASSGVLSVDIDGLTELSAAPHATDDEFMVSDNGTEKRVSMTNVANGAFALVSGDATIATGGALTIANDAVQAAMLNDDVISGQDEIADGELADADELLLSDGGVLKKVGVDTLKSFVNIGATPATVAAGDTLTDPGVYYMADMGSDGEDTITIGAAVNWIHGMSIKLKLPSDASSDRYVTVNTSGAQFIDGASSIRLESPFAAVELIYVADNTWRVF